LWGGGARLGKAPRTGEKAGGKSGGGAGLALGGLGGWLGAEQGWSRAYEIIAVPNLALAVVLFFVLREPPREGVAEAAADGGLPGMIGRAHV